MMITKGICMESKPSSGLNVKNNFHLFTRNENGSQSDGYLSFLVSSHPVAKLILRLKQQTERG